ncbi:VTT domain-containing protein [uncultured Methylobacterium sp.]|uniref:TVP38/TMEM64 family protein n=1 Tax=uncultured Methylobacterium sp. TaxID=157278 RepID=UPI002616885F|nr:VTT domain-containing protein [uncultured Methylobacterium sp.]
MTRLRAALARPLVAALLLVLAGGTLVGLASPATVTAAAAEIAAACERAGPLGWVLIAVIQVSVVVSGALPASLIGMIAGALYGPALGFVLACIGTLAGAMLSFAIGRTIARPLAASIGGGRLRLDRVDALLERKGWRAVCLLRLSPVMPFAIASYALSATRVRPGAYFVGTLAALPSLLAYVAAGAVGRSGGEAWLGGESWVFPALFCVGVAATLVLVVQVRRSLCRTVGGEAGDWAAPNPEAALAAEAGR